MWPLRFPGGRGAGVTVEWVKTIATGGQPRQAMAGKTAYRSKIEQICADTGLRMTEQRRVIARVLSDAEDHPDVEEVYRRASNIDNRISLSTVYRTVRLLEEKGILERHDFGDGRARYERVRRQHHDHLIDMDSGEVIEFQNEEIEKLQERVARELGYRLVGHRLELYGIRLDASEEAKRSGRSRADSKDEELDA